MRQRRAIGYIHKAIIAALYCIVLHMVDPDIEEICMSVINEVPRCPQWVSVSWTGAGAILDVVVTKTDILAADTTRVKKLLEDQRSGGATATGNFADNVKDLIDGEGCFCVVIRRNTSISNSVKEFNKTLGKGKHLTGKQLNAFEHECQKRTVRIEKGDNAFTVSFFTLADNPYANSHVMLSDVQKNDQIMFRKDGITYWASVKNVTVQTVTLVHSVKMDVGAQGTSAASKGESVEIDIRYSNEYQNIEVRRECEDVIVLHIGPGRPNARKKRKREDEELLALVNGMDQDDLTQVLQDIF